MGAVACPLAFCKEMVTIDWYDSMLGALDEQTGSVNYALRLVVDYNELENEGYDPVLFELSSAHQTILSKWSELPIKRILATLRKALEEGAALTTLDFAVEEVDIWVYRRALGEFEMRLVIRDFVTIGTAVSIQGLVTDEAGLRSAVDELAKLAKKQA